MKSSALGNTIFPVEITSISPHGIWMLFRDEELFLSYLDFPWFKDQPRQKISNVQEISPEHFYWPDMDIDLCLNSIREPARFPLIAK